MPDFYKYSHCESSAKDVTPTRDEVVESMKKCIEPMVGGRYSLLLCPGLGSFVQFRVPKSKKSRIRKKWVRSRRHSRFVPCPDYFLDVDNRTIVCHPNAWDRVLRELEAQGITVSSGAASGYQGLDMPYG